MTWPDAVRMRTWRLLSRFLFHHFQIMSAACTPESTTETIVATASGDQPCSVSACICTLSVMRRETVCEFLSEVISVGSGDFNRKVCHPLLLIR